MIDLVYVGENMKKHRVYTGGSWVARAAPAAGARVRRPLGVPLGGGRVVKF